MKRGFLEMTKGLFRQKRRLIAEPYDLSDSNYYIYLIHGYNFSSILQEIENVDYKKNLSISINTQYIKNTDFLIEQNGLELFVKIIKGNISYEISETDRVEIFGQFQKYA